MGAPHCDGEGNNLDITPFLNRLAGGPPLCGPVAGEEESQQQAGEEHVLRLALLGDPRLPKSPMAELLLRELAFTVGTDLPRSLNDSLSPLLRDANANVQRERFQDAGRQIETFIAAFSAEADTISSSTAGRLKHRAEFLRVFLLDY